MSDSIVRLPYRSVSVPGGSSGFDAADIPSAFMYKTTNVAQTSALSTNTPAKLTITTTAGMLVLFTMPSANTLKYVGTEPFKAKITGHIDGAANATATINRMNLYLNSSPILAAENSTWGTQATWNNNSGIKSYPLIGEVDMVTNDEISIWGTDVYDPEDWDTWAAAVRIDFGGWN